MRRIVFTAVLAFVATQASVQAAESMALTNTNFPARINPHAELLKKYDKDGDGKLNDQERAAMMEERHDRMAKMIKAREKEFDKDGDGKLNEQEKAAMMAEMQKRHPNGPRFQEMIKRFDKDGDGKLNDEERKAMQQEQAARMQRMAAAAKTASVTNAVPAK